jgi:alanine racemase
MSPDHRGGEQDRTSVGPGSLGTRESLDADGLRLGRPNRFEIDLDAIEHNAGVLRALVGPGLWIFAAVKGDAYGYGMVEVARAALAGGANGVSLVSVADAVKLRRQGVSAPVLLYPGTLPDAHVAAAVERYDFMPTVMDLDAARLYSSRRHPPRKVFVKVDVGLERLGVAPERAVEFVTAVAATPGVTVEGVYAHMHRPDGPGATPYLEWQFGRFQSVLAHLRHAGLHIPLSMTASTSVLQASTSAMTLNAIDPGLLFLGLDARGPGLGDVGLRPAFVALKTRLVQVKDVGRTEFRDHAPFPITGPLRMGVIPIGRCDGMDGISCGQVLVKGVRANLLGSPNTEHTRVDLTHVPGAAVGDEVVLIGRQGAGEITPDEVARKRGVSSAGMVALGIRHSVPRIYLRAKASSTAT